MNIKGIIFDLDGVICHTDHYHYLAWKAISDRFAIPFTPEINNRLRGVSRMESLEIILENSPHQFTDEEKLVIAEEKNALYREKLSAIKPTDISNEVRSTLFTLRQRGLHLAIGSSSKNAGYILEKTDCAKYFDAVADGNDIIHSKPHPEVFTLAGERLGLAPTDCVVVEDAVAGIKAAVAAGMMPVAIGDAARADVCGIKIQKLAELLEVVL